MKTSELTGAALDWAVAKCENLEIHTLEEGMKVAVRNGEWEPWWVFTPTSSWAQGGPIIEKNKIAVGFDDEFGWVGTDMDGNYFMGSTPLEAAMRCFVASKQPRQEQI